MRIPRYLSPTSLHLWERDREEFYRKYLADTKRPHIAQSNAMAVGSAFDAFVKCELHKALFGNDGGGEYDLETLMEAQVDADCLPFAYRAGQHTFDRYKICGAYDELLEDLQTSDSPPKFEFTLMDEIGGVPLIGKPDCWYTRNDIQVVLDWKVMGYCSRHTQSPKKLYRYCRDTWGADAAKPTRGGAKAHPKYVELDHHGHKIGTHWLEDVDKKWADQIAIYSWMLGVDVGDESMVTCIDQLACKPHPDGDEPLIRVAQHRCRISSFWQHSLLGRLQDCWNTVNSGHIFSDLSREESDQQCKVLDLQNKCPSDEMDDFWAMVSEKPFRG